MEHENLNTPQNPPLQQTAVSGSISVEANLPKKFAEAVKRLHKQHNCKLKKYENYRGDWKTVIVQGQKEDVEKLNNDCTKIAYGDDV
jgi:hypothetical protein